MRWLSSLEPDSRHRGVRNERLHGSGAGFWKEATFGGGGEARVELVGLSCFTLGIREWESHMVYEVS